MASDGGRMSKVVDTVGSTLGLGLSRTVTIVATGIVLKEKLAVVWPADTMVGLGEIGETNPIRYTLVACCA